MAYEVELQSAIGLLELAGKLALKYRETGIHAEDKPDDSPVTVADRECEKLIVSGLEKQFSHDGFLGEEGTNRESSNGRRWIIDPIDGTRDFVRGNRLWCTLLALEVDGRVEVGVASFPSLNETYWATRGDGAFRNGRRIQVSKITEIGRSVACINQLERAYQRPRADKLLELMSKFWAVRCLGGAMDSMYVCAGHAEFWLEPSAKPWDLAVLQIIAEEAGAVFFDHLGNNTIYGGNAVICVPALVPEARAFLDLP
jgi:histidinol-phosphatase